MTSFSVLVVKDGSIVFAPELLADLGLKVGDDVHMEARDGQILLRPASDVAGISASAD